METIGERLKRVREERGLTQRDVAVPGVSAQYVSKIERGQRTASVKALRKLAPKLGVSARFLETGHDLSESELRDYRLDDAELALRVGGDDAGAERAFAEILDEALADGDGRSASRARLGLGLLAAGRSDSAGAVAALEPAVSDPWVDPVTHADAFMALGDAYVAVGRASDAIALYRRCLADAAGREPRSTAAIVRLSTSLSAVLAEAGETREAHDVLEAAFTGEEPPDDPRAAARFHWKVARAAAERGRFDEAQLSINRAVGLLALAEDGEQLARAEALAAGISQLSPT
jgi:transcriptional regulator with XRE-family HTH domain